MSYNYPPILEYKLNASAGHKYATDPSTSFIRVEFQPGRANNFPANNLNNAIMLKVRTIPNNVNPFDKDYIIPVITTVGNDPITYKDNALIVKSGATPILNGDVDEKFPEITEHLNFGQYYKVQLALVDVTQDGNNNNVFNVSPISNVGIMKFTTIPQLSIDGDGITFIGSYSQKITREES